MVRVKGVGEGGDKRVAGRCVVSNVFVLWFLVG